MIRRRAARYTRRVAQADWTYEKPRAGEPGAGLDGYTVHSRDGEPVGRVLSVLDRDGQLFLALSTGSPPLTGSHVAVPWSDVAEVDHDTLSIELARDDLDLIELDPDKAVEAGEGGDAVRVTEVPGGPPAPTEPGDVAGPRDRGGVLAFGVAAVLGLFAVFGVLAIADATDSPRLLFLLVIPVALLVVCAVLALRALRDPYEADASG